MRKLLLLVVPAALLLLSTGCSSSGGKPNAAAAGTATATTGCSGYAQARSTFDTFKNGMADGSLTAGQAHPVLQQLQAQMAQLSSTNTTVQTAASSAAQDATKLDAELTSGDNTSVSSTASDLRVQMDTLAAYC